MKKALFFTVLFFISITLSYAQQGKAQHKLPAVQIKTLKGEPFSTKDIDNQGDPVIISFWALWCKPCIRELNTISEVYPDWQDETGVKLYAVSIDDVRSSSRVQPFVNGNYWEYEVLLDPNGDFKRAMNVNMIPHMFILDGEKNIVWQHTSFAEGGEYEIYEVLKKIKAGEEVSGH